MEEDKRHTIIGGKKYDCSLGEAMLLWREEHRKELMELRKVEAMEKFAQAMAQQEHRASASIGDNTTQPQQEELPDLLNTDKGRTVFDVLLKQGVVSFDGKMYKWEKTKALYGDIVDYLRGLLKVDDYTEIPWHTFGKYISNHATLVKSAQGHLSKCRAGKEEQANGFVELKKQIEKAIRK